MHREIIFFITLRKTSVPSFDIHTCIQLLHTIIVIWDGALWFWSVIKTIMTDCTQFYIIPSDSVTNVFLWRILYCQKSCGACSFHVGDWRNCPSAEGEALGFSVNSSIIYKLSVPTVTVTVTDDWLNTLSILNLFRAPTACSVAHQVLGPFPWPWCRNLRLKLCLPLFLCSGVTLSRSRSRIVY
jgi:hypothetical protein